MLIEIFVIVLLIIAIGHYVINRPKTIYGTIDYTDTSIPGSSDISIKAKPINYVYNTIYANGIGAADPAGTVTCPTATGVNLIGDNKNYCVFNNWGDVVSYCNTDKNCQGYVRINDVYQVANKWETNNVKNGALVLKQIDTKSLLM